jgi:nucleoside-diphosphate-sugar epimerase
VPWFKRVLVTGATGFLGGHLCRRLLAEGVIVRGTVRRPRPSLDELREGGVELFPAALEDATALRLAAQGADVVFHVAALASYLASRERFEETNVAGTRRVVEAARAAGVRRLVHVSSESVTLQNADRIDEDEAQPYPRKFLDHYSRTKAEAEREVLAANGQGIETAVVRAPWIWGERDTRVFKAIALAIVDGNFALVGDGENRITTGHAQNVAAGLIAAAESPHAPGRVYHVADEVRPTMREFLGRLGEAGGFDLPRRRIPFRLAYAAAWAAERMRAVGLSAPMVLNRPYVIHVGRTWTLDDGRARRELGYRPPVSMDEGFGRLAAWIAQCGGLEAALGRPPRAETRVNPKT